MSAAVIRRLITAERVRFPLEVLFVFAWGFLLIGVFATSESFTEMLEQSAEMMGPTWSVTGDPLAGWVAIGLLDPPFFLGGGVFAIGLGLRAIAGELQDGSLDLALSRPVSRRGWFLAHLAVMIPGSFAIGILYSVGCLIAAEVTDPIGSLDPWWAILAGAEAGLLFVGFGALGLLVSSLSSDRGRALAWTLGVLVVMYVVAYLVPLWGVAEDLAKATPFGWYSPGPILQTGELPWRDIAALAAFAVVPGAIALWRFERRDLPRT